MGETHECQRHSDEVGDPIDGLCGIISTIPRLILLFFLLLLLLDLRRRRRRRRRRGGQGLRKTHEGQGDSDEIRDPIDRLCGIISTIPCLILLFFLLLLLYLRSRRSSQGLGKTHESQRHSDEVGDPIDRLCGIQKQLLILLFFLLLLLYLRSRRSSQGLGKTHESQRHSDEIRDPIDRLCGIQQQLLILLFFLLLLYLCSRRRGRRRKRRSGQSLGKTHEGQRHSDEVGDPIDRLCGIISTIPRLILLFFLLLFLYLRSRRSGQGLGKTHEGQRHSDEVGDPIDRLCGIQDHANTSQVHPCRQQTQHGKPENTQRK